MEKRYIAGDGGGSGGGGGGDDGGGGGDGGGVSIIRWCTFGIIDSFLVVVLTDVVDPAIKSVL